MGKNSGTTRSGGSSNPKGTGNSAPRQNNPEITRRVNESWSNYWLSDLDGLVKKTTLAQEFVLEPADRGDDVALYSLYYSPNRDRYAIWKEQGGRSEVIAESPAIADIVRLAKNRGLMAVGVRRKSDRR